MQLNTCTDKRVQKRPKINTDWPGSQNTLQNEMTRIEVWQTRTLSSNQI